MSTTNDMTHAPEPSDSEATASVSLAAPDAADASAAPASRIPPPPSPVVPDGEEAGELLTPQQLRRLSRRSFLTAGIATAASLGGLWAFNKYAPDDGMGLKTVFRASHQTNEAVAQGLFFRTNHLAREYPRSYAREPRNNYKGATPYLHEPEAWRLTVDGIEGASAPRVLRLTDVQALPKVSQTTELKCVEGWSVIVSWTGARLVDFMKQYPPPPGAKYVAMRSEPEGWEDEWYYIGLDMPACQHPQALLAWQMNGADLTPEHGAPLRLVMPHKYGTKNIKLITHIAYTTERPRDYWAENGYDWYGGL